MAISFKGAHFPQEIILMGVRWYVAYPLSYRHVEELMQERGVPVDHATLQRWVVKYSPLLEAAFHRTQACGVAQLAHGRDVHQGQRPVVLSLSCGG
jgi:transposase-like protein